jgi:hypothetical protein
LMDVKVRESCGLIRVIRVIRVKFVGYVCLADCMSINSIRLTKDTCANASPIHTHTHMRNIMVKLPDTGSNRATKHRAA